MYETCHQVYSWDRYFNQTEMLHRDGKDVTENCSRICNIMMTRDERLREMIKALFTTEDYLSVKKRMIGTDMNYYRDILSLFPGGL